MSDSNSYYENQAVTQELLEEMDEYGMHFSDEHIESVHEDYHDFNSNEDEQEPYIAICQYCYEKMIYVSNLPHIRCDHCGALHLFYCPTCEQYCGAPICPNCDGGTILKQVDSFDD